MAKGFIYILSNQAFPDLLKIGWSTKVPTERAAELFTTGLPNPFQVEYYCLTETEGGENLERCIHDALADFRVSNDREFFRISAIEAKTVIEQHCTPEHTWSSATCTRIKPKQEMQCTKCGANFFGRPTCLYCSTELVPKVIRTRR